MYYLCDLHRHVIVLLPGAKGSGQHPETLGQGGGSLYDAHQRPDAQQRTRGHDHVCNNKVQQINCFFFLVLRVILFETMIIPQFENETQKYEHFYNLLLTCRLFDIMLSC